MYDGKTRYLETEYKNWVIEHSNEDQLYRLKNEKSGTYLAGAYTTQLFAKNALDEYKSQPAVSAASRPGAPSNKKKERETLANKQQFTHQEMVEMSKDIDEGPGEISEDEAEKVVIPKK